MVENTMNHCFSHVFSKLNIEEDVKKLFNECIVSNIIINKSSKEIDIYLNSTDSSLFDKAKELEAQIKSNFKGVSRVSIKIIPQDMNSNQKREVLQHNWNDILSLITQENPFLGAILYYAHWEVIKENLQIILPYGYKNYIEKMSCKETILRVLSKFIGTINIDFKYSMKTKENMPKIEEETKNIIHQQLISVSNSVIKENKNERLDKEEQEDNIILGKEFSGNITKLAHLPENDESVIIQVEILNLEFRELKNENKLVIIDVTDYSNSITCKFFVKKEQFDKVKGNIKKGSWVNIKGILEYDSFIQERIIKAKDITKASVSRHIRMDEAPHKRVELHAHTQMSSMDAVVPVGKLIERAAMWGHKAIAITDHGVVQAYPDAAAAAKKNKIKVIYGVEAYIVDDLTSIVQSPKGQTFDDTYIVFDLETTGFNPGKDKITEIGAIKIKNGEIVDRYQTFVNPQQPISQEVIELTGITNEMVANAPTIEEVLPNFLDFIKDGVLVAHNAEFDVSFISYFAKDINYEIKNSVVDTLGLSRLLLPKLTKHKLNFVAQELDIELKNHHRAIDDAYTTALIFLEFLKRFRKQSINTLDEINLYAAKQIDVKKLKTYHAIILVKNQAGLVNLYKMISKAHIEFFFKRPRIPKSLYLQHNEGLIIGSACEAGELYKAILENKAEDVVKSIASFYDYLEIQPIANNEFLINNHKVPSNEKLRNINKKIVDLGKQLDKLVIASGDVHFLDPEDEIYRRIIMKGQNFADADHQPPLYLHTTDEFLREFAYLGEETAYQVVIENPNKIADLIEEVKPIPDETFPPEIEGAEEELINITTKKAREIYGDPLPEPVKKRLDRELDSIIKNGFAVLYIIAQKLVWKSLEDGYLVGSRGSVGSSFVATMASITEVNPLPPHYVCPSCKYSDFDSEDVKKFAGGSGCDMPDKKCPVCGNMLYKDGHDIPFETFLGFDGDKEPDIDLNFSGEYQSRAHTYTEELFGSSHVFRAGTIGTLAEKTAYGFVQKYLEEKNMVLSKAEVGRLTLGCTGIKRTTGQHPGGLMIVPRNNDIHNFCPVQRPANDMKSTTTTTHFDYHSISGRLLKLDLLGHDDPTIIRMLEDITGVDAKKIPLDDKKVMSLFTSTEALKVTKEEINSDVGSLGLPEFGTKFVRQMLVDTKPSTFSDLIRISGLSHGTDVWLNNAQELVKEGKANISEVISTRDDIMVYLIIQGVEKKSAFKIMESVRKGKGLSPEQEKEMREAGVKDWYIDSCKKIKYMFPKAHAAAYVMMAFRIAYFKVYYPEAFYAAYFSIRAKGAFDYELMCKGRTICEDAIKDLEQRSNLSTKEKDILTVLEVVREMYARGIVFKPIDIYESDAERFIIKSDGILPPFNSLQGLGDTAAKSIVESRKAGNFLSIEDFKNKTKTSGTIIEVMKQNNILKDLPETSQLSLF